MDFMSIVWAVLGFAMILAEFMVPGVVIIFFGLGAVLTAVTTALLPGLSASLVGQILAWLGFSTFSLIGLRKKFKSVFTGKVLNPSEHAFDDGGQEAVVLEDVDSEEGGRISYLGTSWHALSFDRVYKKGERVWILKKEGLTYYVGEPLDEKPSIPE